MGYFNDAGSQQNGTSSATVTTVVSKRQIS